MVNLITTNASSHPSHGALGTLVQLELRGALPGPRTCRGAVQTPAELQDLALSHSAMPWAVQANAWGILQRLSNSPMTWTGKDQRLACVLTIQPLACPQASGCP